MTGRLTFCAENTPFGQGSRLKNDDILILPYPPVKNCPVTENVITGDVECGLASKQSNLEADHGSIV